MAKQTKLRALDLFVLIAGAVIILQMLGVSTSTAPITFMHLGTLPLELVIAVLALIIVLSAILVILAIISIAPQLLPNLNQDSCRPIPLVIGAELTIFGLSLINLSDLVISSPFASFVPLGIELYCFGMMSMVSFVEKMGGSLIVSNVPNFSYPLFFLLFLPASFLISP